MFPIFKDHVLIQLNQIKTYINTCDLVCPFITNVDSRWMHHFPRLIDSIKQYQVMTDTGQPLRKSLIWLDMGVKKSHYFVLKLYKVQYAAVSVHQSSHVVKLPLQSLFLLKITADKAIEGHHLGICHQRYLKSCWDWHQLKSLTTGNISLPHIVRI